MAGSNRRSASGPRALVLHGPHDARVERRPAAAVVDEVRLCPEAVGLCGSDVHGYTGRTARRAPGTVMGHEVAARVIDPRSALNGRLVVVDPVRVCGVCPSCAAGATNRCAHRRLQGCTPELPGGFAEELRAPAEALVPLATDLPAEVAALCEPLAVALHGCARTDLRGRRVVVLGAGAIGLTTALAAQRAGAAQLVVCESSPDRQAIAEAMGLSVAAAPADEAQADVVLECVGSPATIAAAMGAVAPGGTVVCIGLSQPAFELDAAALVMDERTLTGSAVYTHAEFVEAAAWLPEIADRVALLVQRRVALEDLPAVLQDYAEGRESAIRTVVVS